MPQQYVTNAGGAPSIQEGTSKRRPSPGTPGRPFLNTDNGILYRDTGTQWVELQLGPQGEQGPVGPPGPKGDTSADTKISLLGKQTWKTDAEGGGPLALDPADGNTCALAYDGAGSLFIGCNVKPARVVKVDLATMTRVGHVTLRGNDTRVSSLIALGPNCIIHGSFDNPCIFTKIDGRTMTITKEIDGLVETVNDKNIRPFTFDGKYIYAGVAAGPGKVVRIEPTTFTRKDSITLNAGPVRGLTFVKGFLYAMCDTSPGQIVRIAPEASGLYEEDKLTAANANHKRFMTAVTDGQYLYVLVNNDSDGLPLRVLKIDTILFPNTNCIVAEYVGTSEEKDAYSIGFDGTDIVVCSWTNPGHLIKLQTSNMTAKAKVLKHPGFLSKLIYIEPYWYSPSDRPQGILNKFLF